MAELINIDKSLHKEAIVIFITHKDLNMTKKNYYTEDDNGK